ncbi:hypothetical protein [Pseudorhodoplanes sp.]|uniref:hypothetical protein n=1 Tax=Pseudorhodoplanes sp. TaxID=1934341 RepID=UPI003D0ED5C9
MPIDLFAREIPATITWFNSFVGFREIWSRVERAEAKLRDLDFASPILNRRYFFHLNYKRIVQRNRLHQKISTDSFENNEPISFMAAIRDAASNLSEQGRQRLRSKLLDGLSPDRDIRELQHELRVYVHYKQQHCKVSFVDLEGRGNHDFDVTYRNTTFEVEAKTVSEDIGNLVSTETSIQMLLAFKDAINSTPDFNESGILRYAIKKRPSTPNIRENFASILRSFLSKGAREAETSEGSLTFEKRDSWRENIALGNFTPIRQEIDNEQERSNPHAVIVVGKGKAVLLCVTGNRPTYLVKGIMRRLKSASQQFSQSKAAVVWVHFLGLDEPAFVSLREEAQAGVRNAFIAFGNYVFQNELRSHVCKLRLSSDSQELRRATSKLMLSGVSEMISNQGPAYDMTSLVSRFDPETTI